MKNQITSTPTRILVHAPLGVGGITNIMLDIQSGLDRDKLNFDYLVMHDRIEPQEERAFALGANKFCASTDDVKYRPFRAIARLAKIKNICKNNNIKVLHYNGGSPSALLNLFAARLGGVKYITFHSHNGGQSVEGLSVKLVSMICKPLLPLVVDDFWACSRKAAEYSFPRSIIKKNKYYFMPNAIDTNKYAFNKRLRNEVRKELGVEGKFVVGHAGRFNHQKNHKFLIDVFAELVKKEPNAILILFGEGELKEEIEQQIEQKKLNSNVIVYGKCNEMEKMYQAMDIFVMPSKFEGLPVTGVEAQVSGLPMIFSDTITEEVKLTAKVSYLSLNASYDDWVSEILKYKECNRDGNAESIARQGFDRTDMIRHFEHYYLSVCERLK